MTEKQDHTGRIIRELYTTFAKFGADAGILYDATEEWEGKARDPRRLQDHDCVIPDILSVDIRLVNGVRHAVKISLSVTFGYM